MSSWGTGMSVYIWLVPNNMYTMPHMVEQTVFCLKEDGPDMLLCAINREQ